MFLVSCIEYSRCHDNTDICVIFYFHQDANFAIVLEEDLDISIDFFRYVLQYAQPLLKKDR